MSPSVLGIRYLAKVVDVYLISVAATMSSIPSVACSTQNHLIREGWVLEPCGFEKEKTLLHNYASSWLQLPNSGFPWPALFPNMNSIWLKSQNFWPLYWFMDTQHPSFSFIESLAASSRPVITVNMQIISTAWVWNVQHVQKSCLRQEIHSW